MPIAHVRKAIPWLLVAWAALVVAVYYRRAWALLVEGPGAWGWSDVDLPTLTGGLPYLRDAAGRSARGIGAAVMVLGAAWTCGALALRAFRLRCDDLLERVTVQASLGVGLLGYVLFGLAAVGLYTPRVVTALVAGLALAGAARLAGLAVAGARLAAGRGARMSHAAAWSRARALSAPGWLTVLAVGTALVCALAPESEYDALWYHLELPRRWLAAGHPVDDVTEYVSLYPLHWELLYGAAMPLGGSVGARLLHWAMLPAGGAVAALWARRLAAPPWLAAAVFVTAPTVLWEATTAYADLALTLHAGVGGWALLRALELGGGAARQAGRGGGAEPDRPMARGTPAGSRRWLLVAAVAFGFACATKHLGLVALASGGAVYAVAGWSRGARRQIAADLLVLGLTAVALASPWYAWSAARSGNPVFPELYGVFGASPPERWSGDSEEALGQFKARFGRPRTIANQLTLPWHLTMHGTVYGGTFGPVLLAALPAVALVAARRKVAAALAAAAILYVLVWASPLSSPQARFLVPAWLVAAPLVAAAVTSGMPQVPVVRWLVLMLLALDLPPAIPLHEGDRRGWDGWLTHVTRSIPAGVVLGGVSDEEYLRRQVRSYAAWRWIDAHVPREDAVLSFSGGDHFYTRHRRLWSDAEAARTITWWARSEAAALAALHDRGIRWVLVPEPRIRSAKEDALPLVTALRRRGVVPLYRDWWYAVYRVEAGTLPGGVTDHR